VLPALQSVCMHFYLKNKNRKIIQRRTKPFLSESQALIVHFTARLDFIPGLKNKTRITMCKKAVHLITDEIG